MLLKILKHWTKGHKKLNDFNLNLPTLLTALSKISNETHIYFELSSINEPFSNINSSYIRNQLIKLNKEQKFISKFKSRYKSYIENNLEHHYITFEGKDIKNKLTYGKIVYETKKSNYFN